MKTNKNDLFYICSLIESVSRESGNSKAEIVDILGEKKIKRLYKFAEVNHCLPIEQVTDEVINLNQINRKEKTVYMGFWTFVSEIDSRYYGWK